MIKINLNPEKKKTKFKKKGISFKAPSISLPKQNVIYIGIPLAVVIISIGYYFDLQFQIKDLQNKKRTLLIEKTKYRMAKRQIDILKSKIKEAEIMKDDVSIKINIYQKLAKEKRDFGKILYAISVSVPDGIWLTHLSIARNDSRLKGYTFDPQYITIFYQNLKKYYKDIDFRSTKRAGEKSLVFYSFDFNMKNFKRAEKSP